MFGSRKRTLLTACVGFSGLLAVTGTILDGSKLTTSMPLFVAFMAASLGGSLLGSLAVWLCRCRRRTHGESMTDPFRTSAPRTNSASKETASHWLRIEPSENLQPDAATARADAEQTASSDGSVRALLMTRGSCILYGVCVYLVWRLTYFPFMVFAGTGAAFAEALATSVGLPVLVYGCFLLLLGLLHATAALLAGLPFVTRRPGLLIPGLLALLPAAAISLSQPVDLHLLPDRCWHLASANAEPSPPVGNPYSRALERPEYRMHQRLLLFAAGSTYDLIPQSPWSRTVQGTLESLFRHNPLGSTADRVAEHYLGYLVAHPRIGHVSQTTVDIIRRRP